MNLVPFTIHNVLSLNDIKTMIQGSPIKTHIINKNGIVPDYDEDRFSGKYLDIFGLYYDNAINVLVFQITPSKDEWVGVNGDGQIKILSLKEWQEEINKFIAT